MHQLFLRLFRIVLTVLCCLMVAQSAQAQKKRLTDRSDVKAFVQHMVKTHQFDKKQLETWLNQVQIQPEVLKSIAKPAESLPWYRYEPIFLTPERVNAGVQFWQENAATLTKASEVYGVPPEIIVAILGVETFYGKRAGKYGVFDSLVTLAFDYPPRAKFFRSELEQFLLLARTEKWDPKSIKGSYAGAMGYPQFIASSYHRFAVNLMKITNGICCIRAKTPSAALETILKPMVGNPINPLHSKRRWKANNFSKRLPAKPIPSLNIR